VGLFDDVHEPLDVYARTFTRILFEHLSRGERREMVDNIHIGRKSLVEHVSLDILDIVGKVLRRAEIAVVECDDIVINSKRVRKIRSDETRTTCNEYAIVFHTTAVVCYIVQNFVRLPSKQPESTIQCQRSVDFTDHHERATPHSALHLHLNALRCHRECGSVTATCVNCR